MEKGPMRAEMYPTREAVGGGWTLWRRYCPHGVSVGRSDFSSVPYRDHRFWIDDRDLRSKSVFSFLMFLFTLLETSDKGGAPIVTIPTR